MKYDRLGCRIIKISHSIQTQGGNKSQALADFSAELNPQLTRAENTQWTLSKVLPTVGRAAQK